MLYKLIRQVLFSAWKMEFIAEKNFCGLSAVKVSILLLETLVTPELWFQGSNCISFLLYFRLEVRIRNKWHFRTWNIDQQAPTAVKSRQKPHPLPLPLERDAWLSFVSHSPFPPSTNDTPHLGLTIAINSILVCNTGHEACMCRYLWA